MRMNSECVCSVVAQGSAVPGVVTSLHLGEGRNTLVLRASGKGGVGGGQFHSPCTSRCSCTIRDLYSPHFSYRVCCKRHPPPPAPCQQLARNKQEVGRDRLRGRAVHRRNFKVKSRFAQVNGPLGRLMLEGAGTGGGEGPGGHYPGSLTFRYCSRASNSAFRIDVPYRVSSLGRLGNQKAV